MWFESSMLNAFTQDIGYADYAISLSDEKGKVRSSNGAGAGKINDTWKKSDK